MTARVVLTSTAMVHGGVLRHVGDLARGLVADGRPVSICGPGESEPVRALARANGLDFLPLEAHPLPGSILHLHLADTYQRDATALLARWRRAGARTVVTEHLPRTNASDRSLTTDRRKPGAQLYKTWRKRRQTAVVDRLVAVSESSARFLLERYRLDPGLVAVVENGLPEEEMTAGRPFLERSGVVTVGSLIRQKGHERLIRAAAVSAEPWPLTFVGTGPQRPDLERLAGQLVPGRVTFAGWQADPDQVVGRALVAALPSRWESFPYAVGEARAVGTPVVGAPVDGIVDQIEDGVTGILADPEDPTAFAAAIDGLVGDPQHWERVRRAGLEHAARFSLKRMVEDTQRVYESVLGEGMPFLGR